ncbi:DNA-directed DNA polymerase [Tanacetum coccineum]
MSIRTNHDREFDNEVQFGEFCNANGITHNFTAPRTPQSNSVVERKNRTLQEMKPKNVNEALTDESWIIAMQEELNQFIANDVWELVPQPRNMTIIGTKWVFRNKLDENGIVSQNKARLVAQGYNQQEGIDYDETYAPVTRLESIRILLAYDCALDFKLFQMDVKSAFLNGFINEEVYVAQPPGFIDFEKPDHVYKLKKALYGLKQVPKACKMRAFWSLNEDILKITILKTNTPYPSRKIRRIRACTHQRPQRNKDQYFVSRENQYAVFKIWNQYNILEDIKRGPYSKKSPIRLEPEKPVGSNKVLTNDQPQITSEHVVQPSNEVQPPPVPFPRRLRKEKDKVQQKKFLENLKQLHINLPFIEALAQMLKYDKFLKGFLTNKGRLEEACKIIMNERCSAVLLNKLLSKEKDPGSFTIPYDIGQLHIDNALADLGARISLMPYTMYKKLGLGEPKATRMSLELADRSIQYLRGIIENVLIKVDKFVLPIDFVTLDMPEDSRVPIILGRPFLATARAMINVFNKKITLRVGDDEIIFDVDQSTKRPTTEDDECYRIDDLDKTINDEAQELLANEEPDSFLSRGLEKSIDQSDLECCESTGSNEKNGADSYYSTWRIDSANTPYPVTQETTNGDDVKSEHLYSASANEIDEKRKGAIAWKMSDIKEISSSYCTHKILMEDDYKPVIQPQRRLNPKVQDVVKNEIVKLLDSSLIYPISWVSPIHVVPKKGGMTVVLNDNNELIPSRTVIGWRDFSKYQSLQRIKKRLPSPVLMGLSLTDECRLDYAMLLPLFKDA